LNHAPQARGVTTNTAIVLIGLISVAVVGLALMLAVLTALIPRR
jgi:hypothetical protein